MYSVRTAKDFEFGAVQLYLTSGNQYEFYRCEAYLDRPRCRLPETIIIYRAYRIK